MAAFQSQREINPPFDAAGKRGYSHRTVQSSQKSVIPPKELPQLNTQSENGAYLA